MPMILLFDSAMPVGSIVTSRPGIKPSLGRNRCSKASGPLPGRTLPMLLPLRFRTTVMTGCATQTIARQTVSTDDNDGRAPRGGDGRGGSRIRTHMNISGNQSADRWAAGADVNKPGIESMFFKQTCLLCDP